MSSLNLTNNEEEEKISDIFEKSSIPNIKKLQITINENDTDIDVFGIYRNIIFLVECCGRKGIGPKSKKAKSDFGTVEENFSEVIKKIEKEYKDFYKSNKDHLKSTKFKFRRIILASSKETKEEIDKKNKRFIESCIQASIWTTEEIYYFQRISDCTYDHCKYEILAATHVSPLDIESEEESSVPSYVAYGRKIKEGVYLLNIEIPVKTLLKRCNVKRLRSSTDEGYQRLLNKGKLKKMRKYLYEGADTYPTNIISVIKNSGVRVHEYDECFKPPKTKETQSSREDNIKDIKNNLFVLDLPKSFDVFEIIDGQHRVFSFSQTRYSEFEKVKGSNIEEVKKIDKKIKKLAVNQNLTVTCICKDDSKYSSGEASLWDNPAKLFLDINTKQTNINPEDVIDIVEKYDKENPDYKPIVESNLLLKYLNYSDSEELKPLLAKKIKFKPWQKNKLKRISLIKHSGLKEFFNNNKKSYEIIRKAYNNQNKIKDYVRFCFVIINNYFESMGKQVKKENGQKKFNKMYKDLNLKNYYLFSAVYIGALIRLMRHFFVGDGSKLNFTNNLDDKIEKKKGSRTIYELNKNNESIQDLFSKVFEFISKKRKFTKREFENWGYTHNSWAKIESDLFYLIRDGLDENFGDENLISKNHRRY